MGRLRAAQISLRVQGGGLNFEIEFEQEEDRRWIAEIPELPGVMAYGATQAEAGAAVEALASRM